VPLQFCKFWELPLQFIYFEQCHYNSCDVQIVPYYTYPTMLDPQTGYCNFVWAKMPPSHRIVGSACHLLLSLSSSPPVQLLHHWHHRRRSPRRSRSGRCTPRRPRRRMSSRPRRRSRDVLSRCSRYTAGGAVARHGAAPRTVAAGRGRRYRRLRGWCAPVTPRVLSMH
jgi:hypothetical protein